MKQLFKAAFASINNLIVKSISTDQVSATRLSSFMILAPIQLMILVVTLIELVEFGFAVYRGSAYTLSNEFIITFGMVLSHHLAILFSRSKSQSRKELESGASETTTSTETEVKTETTKEETTETKTL